MRGSADYVQKIDAQGFKITRIDNNNLYGHGPKWNASTIEHNGRRLLSYRQYDPRLRVGEGNGMTIAITELNKKNKPFGKHYPLDLQGIGEHKIFEDARLFKFRGDLWLSYTEVVFVDPYKPMKTVRQITQHACKLEGEHFLPTNPITLDYGYNFSKWEKNWCWFEWNDRLFCCYDPRTNLIFEVDPVKKKILHEWKHHDVEWPYGHFRGGTPPVLHNGKFISFWHGSTDDPLLCRRYYLGAYTFEAKPPFKPIGVSAYPLIYGSSNEAFCGSGNEMCIFPMGKRRLSKGWQVACGINDSFCALIDIPDSQIDLVKWGWHHDLEWTFYRMTPEPYVTISGIKDESRTTRRSGMSGSVAVLKTKDPFTISHLSHKKGVDRITAEDFQTELRGLERQIPEKQRYSYLGKE